MATNTQTFEDFVIDAAERAALAQNIEIEEAEAQVWERIKRQVSNAGIDPKDFVKDHFRSPYEQSRTIKLEVAVGELIDEDMREQGRTDEQMLTRSPSTDELIRQQKRVGQSAVQQWGAAVEPSYDRVVRPEMTDQYRSVPPTKVEIPVSAHPIPESRFDMEQRLATESQQSGTPQLTQREYERRLAESRAQQAIEATVIDDKSLSTHTDEAREEAADRRREKLIRARSRVERQQKLYGVDPGMEHWAARGNVALPSSAGSLPKEPEDWTNPEAKKKYFLELAQNPAIQATLQHEIEDESYDLGGGALGTALRPIAPVVGGIAGAGMLAAEYVMEPAADFLFSQIHATADLFGAESITSSMEEEFGKRLAKRARGESVFDTEFAKDANVDAMYRAGIENNELIESRLADQDFWKSARADFADNVSALGELVALFMPTSLDLLKELRSHGDLPESAAARAALSFELGMKKGMALPAGMAGAVLSMLSDPTAAAAAQPVTMLMTLLPLAKILKAAKIKGVSQILDQLDDVARRAGIDLDDPNFKKLTFSEDMANRLLNEARTTGRTKWAKATQSSVGRFFLNEDYIRGVQKAVETGTRAPELMTLETLDPGIARAGKVGAATYLATQEDAEAALLALTTVATPSLTLRGIVKVAEKTGWGPAVEAVRSGRKWKAASGRLAVNIALMADPNLTLRVQEMVDNVLSERNLLESDIVTLKQALGSAKGRLAIEKLVPDVAEVLVARATLKGRVDGLPDVAEARSAWDAADVAVKEAEELGLPPVEIIKLRKQRLDLRTKYRMIRRDRLLETAEDTVFVAPETGALEGLRRLVQRDEDIKIDLQNEIAKIDLDESNELGRVKKANTPEKIEQLRAQLTEESLRKVGIKAGARLQSETQAHLSRLEELSNDVQTKVGEELDAAVAKYNDRLAKAQLALDARLKRNAKNQVGRTTYETSLLDEMRKAEMDLSQTLSELRTAAAERTGDIAAARKAVLDGISRKRVEAADRVGRGIRGLEKEALARDVDAPIAAKEAELATIKEKYAEKRKAKKRELDLERQEVANEMEKAQKTIETHNTRAVESSFLGDIADGDAMAEGYHVYTVEAPARFDAKRGTMVYLDPEGNITKMAKDANEGVRAPIEGLADEIRELMKQRDEGLITEAEFTVQEAKLLERGDRGNIEMIDAGVIADDSNAIPKRLEGAYMLESLATLTGDEASAALKAIVRSAKNIANSDLGFTQVFEALGGDVKGGMGGRNVAARYYMQIFHDVLMVERHSALLRSPTLRNQFSKWLNKELADALNSQPITRAGRKKLKAGLGKLVNDFTFGRTRGIKFLEINPVLELANKQKVSMSQLYQKFMDDILPKTKDPEVKKGAPPKEGQAEKGRLPRQEVSPIIRRARVEALDAFRQQMLGKVEEAAAAKWFWKQVGSRTGWTDANISTRYLGDIAEYYLENRHMPPLLKADPKFIKSRWLENEEATLKNLENRILEKDPEISPRAAAQEARSVMDSVFNDLKEEGLTEWMPWKENNLPSLSDRGTPPLSAIDDGAGIARWKAPTSMEDMAGWTELMGHMKDAVINTNLGGTFNSTVGWLFMANRAMNSGGFFSVMRRMSSAMKRNLTTQRPQTALTNFMSNYLAMITREGLMPQEAAWDIVRTGRLWRQYRLDPKSIPKRQRDRIKGFMDRGISSNNAVNVDANIVLDTFNSSFASKTVDLYSTGVRRLPVVGKVMETFDEAYQAGDGIYKLTDAERAIGRLDTWQQELRPGNSITYLDDSRNGFVVGRAFRLIDGQLEVEYKGKHHRGKQAEKYLEEMKMDASVGYANGLYHDYSRVPGFIELARNFDAFMFGPFKTWAWKSIDIPFIKRGMGTRALFGSELIKSTDANVMSSMLRQQTLASMRKAAVFSMTRSTNRKDEYLRMLLPEWLAQTAFFDEESLSFQSMGARNFAIGASQLLDAMWKMTRGTEEDILMKKFRKKERPPIAELSKMVFADGIVTGTLLDLLEGVDNSGNPIKNPKDYFHFLAGKLAPGWVYSATDSLGTMIDSISDLSNMGRSNRFRDEQTRMEMAEYLVKIWTGRRLEHFDRPTVMKSIGHMVGIHTWPIGTDKFGTEMEGGNLLKKHFDKKWKEDWKEWQAVHGAPPKALQEYKEKQRVYWDSKRDKLRSIYQSLVFNLRDSWKAQDDAATKFKDMAKAAENSKVEELRLDTQLDEEAGEQTDAAALLQMTGGGLP